MDSYACIVRSSKEIKEKLRARWKELQLTYADVIRDAKSRGMNIEKGELSHYLNGDKRTMSQHKVLRLCVRWGVKLQLLVSIPGKYNQKECESNLLKLF